MKKILLVTFFIVSLSSLAQNPQNFLNPKIWLITDAKGSNPELWEDLSNSVLDGIPCDTYVRGNDLLINAPPTSLFKNH